ncbi:MAG TPA: serine/threonine-protein kinase, partial [Cryomorphaceae bacterium]|nr:serine/threonine-protein kinase [Cryomorphaceae bacterium]
YKMSEELQYTAFQSRYRDKQYIGAGGFGKVYKVFDHAKNHYVALKVSDVRPEWNKFTLKNEVELVNKLNYHRNIARYDACYRFNTGITGEMDFALLKFYEDGNLEQFLKKSELSQEDKRLIIGGILNGLSFLHDNNIIHRDLKAENILMSREDGVWTPKITDFGLSREVNQSTNITNSAVGISYAYAAPEQILNQKIYRNVDIWAIGVIIYRIIANELPFIDKENADKKSVNTQLEISKKITSNQLPEKLETLEEPFRSIIKRCLVSDPLERAQKPSELIALLKGDKSKAETTDSEKEKTPPLAADDDVLDSSDEKTVLNLRPSEPRKQSESKIEEPAPTPPEYEMPNQNQTQFIPQTQDPQNEVQSEEEEPVISHGVTGDRKGGPSAIIIAGIAIFVLIGAGFIWWLMSGESTASDNQLKKSAEVSFIPQGDALPEASDNDYGDLEEQIKENAENSAELNRIEEELLKLAKDPANADNYRPYYLLALSQSVNSRSPRVIFESLRESATIAANNNSAGELLKDLDGEKSEAFERTSSLRKWSEIIEQLENYR